MIRPSTALCAFAVIVVGYAMFQVKYEVMQQEEEVARVNRQITESREAIRVLQAEWSFLTQPTRLSELAKRYLSLVPIGRAQLGTIDAIPLRDQSPEPAPVQAAPAAPQPVPAARKRPDTVPGAKLAHFETGADQ